MNLYFLFAPGCPACEAAKKPLAAFERANPDVRVIRVNLLEAKWTHPWQPEATPTYVFEIPYRERTQWVGTLESKDDIARFINKSKQYLGVA